MDLVKIGLAVKNGVSPVCATCKWYWEGRERGMPDPQCTRQGQCGGPFAGRTFPEYDGPITDFTQWCFVCAARATKAIKIGEKLRLIGVCDAHVEMLGKVEPVGLKLNGGAAVNLIDAKLGRMTPEQFFGPPKKSLIDIMVETEKEWAEEDEKKRRRR